MNILSGENPKLEEKIISIVELGNKLNATGAQKSALKLYEDAWALMPEPKLAWEMLSSWLSGSFYTAYFDLSDFKMARCWAERQLESRDSEMDTGPLIDLGMVCFELQENEEAFKHFNSAYNYGMARAFKERPSKYLNFYLNVRKQRDIAL